MNSELITHPVVLLSNNAFTITSSCISILSSFILTIISLSSFSLFRLQQNILSITLESIIYLLLLRLNQGVLSLTPYSNYCFVYFFLCLLFSLYSGLLLSPILSSISLFLQFLAICPKSPQLQQFLFPQSTSIAYGSCLDTNPAC